MLSSLKIIPSSCPLTYSIGIGFGHSLKAATMLQSLRCRVTLSVSPFAATAGQGKPLIGYGTLGVKGDRCYVLTPYW